MNIIGHQKIIKLLDRLTIENVLNHAYIFSGPEQTGKFTVALDFAKKLVDAGGNGNKTSWEVNPNIIVIKPEVKEESISSKKNEIKIEEIRELGRKLGLSVQGKFRVVIIDDADKMNKSAQNACLKILEEAYRGTVLILIVQDGEKILPTIASRCQKIKFGVADFKECQKFLISKGVGRDCWDEIFFWSMGRPGLLVALSNDPAELEKRRDSFKEMKNFLSMNLAEKFIYVEMLSKNSVLVSDKLDFWSMIMRENLLGNNLGIKINEVKAMVISEKIEESLRLIKNTNANMRLILEELALVF